MWRFCLIGLRRAGSDLVAADPAGPVWHQLANGYPHDVAVRRDGRAVSVSRDRQLPRKRWVRPVCIVCGALGFIGGLFGILLVVLQWRMMQQLMANPAGPGGGGTGAPAGMWIGLIVAGVISVFFYLIFPGSVWWFYRRESVRQTVYHFDPTPSWTDGLPLRVLTAAIIMLMLAVTGLLIVVRPSYPFFTIVLRDVGLYLTALLLVALGLIAAIQLIRLQSIGWWLALLVPSVQCLARSSQYIPSVWHRFTIMETSPRPNERSS